MTDTPPRTPPPPPPRARAPGSTGTVPPARSRRPSAPPKNLTGQLQEVFESIGASLILAGDFHCGELFTEHAPALAEAYARVAEKNPKIKEWFTRLSTGSDYAKAIGVTLTLVIPILAHHSEKFRETLVQVPFLSLYAMRADMYVQAAEEAKQAAAAAAASGNGNGHPDH